ncbi:MAG TPA: hypothetical protein VK425_03675, partial [Acidimicrobiales bacterium]|nr:hypothetical protein [Acidimicrobiales bacterium]
MGPSGLIPRPPNWLPGAEAPWAGVPLSRRRRIGLADVRRALSGGPEPTGLSAGQARAVTPHELPDLGDPRPAAVLCLLFEKAGQANVLLTRRAA